MSCLCECLTACGLLSLRTTGCIFLCPGFSIEGPSQAKIECDDKGDGSCDVRYWPTEPGDYAVHVICDDEDIKDSPFMAHILPANNESFPEKVSIEQMCGMGRGLGIGWVAGVITLLRLWNLVQGARFEVYKQFKKISVKYFGIINLNLLAVDECTHLTNMTTVKFKRGICIN